MTANDILSRTIKWFFRRKKCYNGIMCIIMVDKALSFGNFNYEDINFNRNISMYLVIFIKACNILESLKCLSLKWIIFLFDNKNKIISFKSKFLKRLTSSAMTEEGAQWTLYSSTIYTKRILFQKTININLYKLS